VANICENKSQDILIKAVSTVIKKHPDIHLELVGKVIPGEEGYFSMLNNLLKQFNLEQNIHFTGEVPYEKIITFLTDSDIFVFPTRAEMMPRSVIEAMVLGKPVVASAVDGILDLIQHRRTGILVEPGNIQELSDALIELIENPDLAHTLGMAGRDFVLDFCSPENVGAQICGFYTQIKSFSRLN
jgi:glycosyltransferase involved in cell wall biosynthesis